MVILDNVRSAHNVGSVFRTADGAGVEKVFLCGYTPKPIDRFNRPVGEIKKTSLGASESMEWEAGDDICDIITRLKAEGIRVVAVEQTKQSQTLTDFSPPEKVAYVFGNEIEGVQPEALALCDEVVEIPMQGQKESLNVSVTVGIVLFS